ncbi:MAG TPA: TetR/AcrR family transcriptional regulator [Streptosporangiaceae bacterium]|nr:TetR/AcrR family transcriptional regulator [Streptosporangiaceae bacterium]
MPNNETAGRSGGRTGSAKPGAAAASVPRTARERARAEITKEILAAGRRHLTTEGAAALSLRAISRDLGMASSAVYRYVASRDDLLTRLIIEAYDSLGTAAEDSEAAVPRDDLAGRWAATCTVVRDWALANPNEYALIYGSPVPGYVAPADTIAPASRVSTLLVQVLVDAADRRLAVPPTGGRAGISAAAAAALAPLRAAMPAQVPDAAMQTGLMVWAGLLGVVSLELFGQFQNVVGENPGDRDAFFAECVRRWAAQLGVG